MELWQGAWKFPHGYAELRWARGMWYGTQFAHHEVFIFHQEHLRFIVLLKTLRGGFLCPDFLILQMRDRDSEGVTCEGKSKFQEKHMVLLIPHL